MTNRYTDTTRIIKILAEHGWEPPYPTTALLELVNEARIERDSEWIGALSKNHETALYAVLDEMSISAQGELKERPE